MITTTYIYVLSCPETGLVRYVGKSNVPEKRYKTHCRVDLLETSKKVSWVKSLNKRGLKPVMNIIDEVPFCDWKFWEKHYIKLYKSCGARLVNSTDGGDGGLCNESREKLSKFFKGKDFLSKEQRQKANQVLIEYCKNNPPWNKGKKYNFSSSKEDVKKRSDAQKGRHKVKEVLQYSLSGSLIKHWKSMSEICEQTMFRQGDISRCCNGKGKSASGFIWIFKTGDIKLQIDPGKLHQKGKTVYQYDKKMNLVKEYNSPKEASEINNIDLKGISLSCCRKNKTYKGFYWKYTKL